jgi:mitotic spindle assembly checkpoint protein MAD1
VRVLSFSANLAQDWVDLCQTVLDRLKEENSALLQRLPALEASGIHNTSSAPSAVASTNTGESRSTTGLVPRTGWATVFQEKAQLEEELCQKEKRMLRLRWIFTAKTAGFLEALLAMLGIKVAFYDSGRVPVTSQYGLGTAFVFHAPRGTGKDGNTGVSRMQLVTRGEGGPAGIATVGIGSRSSRLYLASWRVSRSNATISGSGNENG